ncbi:pectin lyase fold/virulence factor [Rhypophila decipiens]|uniref:Pectin lyase fold/virulence factor n=1 Tax=Rhypophila decipiens TaxID=261697 RepID=A0AAN7B6Y1_9PEZI|nr:pectin lyase fold/virulence factor [Rhypophila decipiens]
MVSKALAVVGVVVSILFETSFAFPSRGSSVGNIRARESSFEQDPATYDDACNIGFCAIMGATIGGWGAESKVVSTQEELQSSVTGSDAAVVVVQGSISGSGTLVIGSGKTIVGLPGSSVNGIELVLSGSRNVIVRNLKVTKPAHGSAAVTIENARSIWIDHLEFSSGSKLNITQGSDYVSITNNLFQDHGDTTPAASVGHSDANGEQDKGKLHVTFGRNHFKNVKNAVSFRFGTGHLFNSYYESFENAINTRMGAEILVEASVFSSNSASKAVLSSESVENGFATIKDVVLGESTATAPAGDMTADSLPYPYDWYMYDKETVQSAVAKYAGQTLEFLVWD